MMKVAEMVPKHVGRSSRKVEQGPSVSASSNTSASGKSGKSGKKKR